MVRRAILIRSQHSVSPLSKLEALPHGFVSFSGLMPACFNHETGIE
jgi:hypothetical protein